MELIFNKGASESILWDKIMEREDYTDDNMVVILNADELKYPLTDLFRNLRSQKVEFRLMVELMPIIGPITRVFFIIQNLIHF